MTEPNGPTEATVPGLPEPCDLTQQQAAWLLVEQLVNSSVDESSELAHQIVRRTAARQAAERAARRSDT